MGLSIGCGGAETGDDTPPAEDEQEETTEAPEGAGGTDSERVNLIDLKTRGPLGAGL